MDLKDNLVQKEFEDLQDCQDFQEHQDFQVCLGSMVLQAREECRVAMGQRVRGVSQEVQESLGSKDFWVHLVCQDQRETQAILSPPIVSEIKEHRVCLVYPEVLADLDLQVQKVRQVPRDPEAMRVVQVLPVFPGLREIWV